MTDGPTRATLTTSAVDLCVETERERKKCHAGLGGFTFVRGTELSSPSTCFQYFKWLWRCCCGVAPATVALLQPLWRCSNILSHCGVAAHTCLISAFCVAAAGEYFGGISSLSVCAAGDDSLLAGVIDWGEFITFPRYPPLGINACSATIYPMLDEAGVAVGSGKRYGDAEGLTCDAEGAVLVSYERLQRVWRYPPPPREQPAAAAAAAAATAAAANASNLGLLGSSSSAFLSRAVDAHLGTVLAACNGDHGNHGVEAMEMINASM